MPDYTGAKKISDFLGVLGKQGGVSLSNTFEVTFKYNESPGKLKDFMKTNGFNASGEALKNLTLFCEEASLPGVMANTGQTTGVRMGEGQVNYAHTRSFQDISFGWICDADMLPVKFLNAWMKCIFNDQDTADGRSGTTRLNYPDDYQCEVTVRKAERDPDSTLGRESGLYTLFNAWPYSIQSTPLSYGSYQLLKITASFYYRRWKFDGSYDS